MCKFWWHTSPTKDKNIHWLSWGNMCKKKSDRGMGFRNIHDFNIALLGKQGWRLLQFPEKLVSKAYKARYYPHGSFLNAKLEHNPNYIWRSVVKSQSLLK